MWAIVENFSFFIEIENGLLYSPVPFIRFLWGVLMIVNAIPVVWSNIQTWENIVEKIQPFQISKIIVVSETDVSHPVMSEHSPEPTVQILWK